MFVSESVSNSTLRAPKPPLRPSRELSPPGVQYARCELSIEALVAWNEWMQLPSSGDDEWWTVARVSCRTLI